MRPELFTIPWLNRPVYSYGLMMVIGLLVAIEVAKWLARRSRINPELFVNAALLALVSGVIGARISDVLENLHDFTGPDKSAFHHFVDAINVTSGGLTFYGGFLLATPVLIAYAVWKKIPVRTGMDIVAPCLMIGLAFGRIGCFLNGCCYGADTNVPWAVHYPYGSIAFDVQFRSGEFRALEPKWAAQGLLVPVPADEKVPTPGSAWGYTFKDRKIVEADPQLAAAAANVHSNWVHPAQLYSTITSLLLAGLLIAYFSLPHAPGRGFALMLVLEGGSRFLLEMLRTENPIIGSWTLSMVIGAGLVVAGMILWMVFGKLAPEEASRMPDGAFPVVQVQ